jgi:trk/ktr system potassium uptake protein
MNLLLLCRLLGLISILIGVTMIFSLPWALPVCGGVWSSERAGFFGLVCSMVVCFVLGGLLRLIGRKASGQHLFLKEAMAIVALSWILATVLGGLPYILSGTYRTPETKMNFVDAIFESQSGFSTTGATVLTQLQDPDLVPRCILFWRSSTHFLGGMGIIVLFVAILGQGSAGKALMRAEMPGPGNSTPQARMQHTAWLLFFVYAALNGILTIILWLENLSWFDALCHAFGTMATGGFSTYNASVGHFMNNPAYNGPLIEMTITVFMVLAGTNFMLLYMVAIGKITRLVTDVEWRTYIAIMAVATVAICAFGLYYGDYHQNGMTLPPEVKSPAERTVTDRRVPLESEPPQTIGTAVRFTLFQVVSIMTTTGYCTDDFNRWCSFSRGVLLLLMFVGGCAGSTGGGLKVIRHILFAKILRLEMEQSFHPSVVRPLRLKHAAIEDKSLRKNILVYFGLILTIFTFSWLLTITLEPNSTWTKGGHSHEHKLIDAASCVSATLNNIGPGIGVIGATHNYTNFTIPTKLLFTWLMMVGRLEVFVVLALLFPRFWRSQ